jgi:alkylhydroperoxidase family enzyme
VAAWRDAPYFTEAERAALALAEAVTRLSVTTRQPAGAWG